jgi:hypothetical protein
VLAEPVVQPAIISSIEETSALRVTGRGELVDADETPNGNGAASGEARLFIDDSHADNTGSDNAPDDAAEDREQTDET